MYKLNFATSFSIGLFLFIASICASPVFAQNPPVDARTAAGCGPLRTEFSVKVNKNDHNVQQPESGKALVYVVVEERPNYDIKIGDVTTRIGVDGTWAAANHGPSFAAFAVDPGDHSICVDWQSGFQALQKLNGAANLSAEPGKTYFFRTVLKTSSPDQPPNLWFEAIDPAEGLLLISRSGKSTWKEKK
jgi:hypothetical protein